MPDPIEAPEQDYAEQDIADEQQPQLGQQPVVQPEIIPPAALPQTVSPSVATPGRAPIAAPANLPAAIPDYRYRQLLQQVSDLPTQQAEAAVAAALRFQGMRGYNNDLAQGKSTREALERWAPLMFGYQRGSTLSGASQFLRATAPPRPTYRDVSGVLMKVDPVSGQVTQLTRNKIVPPKFNPFDLQEHQSLLKQISELQGKIDEDPYGPNADDLRGKLMYLRSKVQDIRARQPTTAQTPLNPPVSAPPVAPPVVARQKTVIRRTKSGRRAVFDEQTHRFLRYAD